VTEGQQITVDVLFTHGADDEDIDVILYDPDRVELAVSESGDDDENIDETAGSTGTYLLFVYGWRGSENTYDLDLTVE